jgi:cytochrome c551/c552
MRRPAFGSVAVVLALATVAAMRFGGWAVVSVQDPPDHFIVDKPTTFDFVVRQHGGNPLDGLTPSVSARKGVRWVNGAVTPRPEPGTYRATIPSAGEWSTTIESGFGPSKGRMLAKRAITAGDPAPRITSTEKGRQLFASAGCVTCHYHSAVDIKPLWDFKAPDLTDKRFAADYLAKFLADPSIKPKLGDRMQMPNPQLRRSDIASLIAFINDERKVATK